MGCVFSKHFLQSKQRCFNVWNVDDQGNHLNHGRIEVTHCDLVLHQRGQGSVHWPLRSLRRYGFDAELFSFECGRRCPTGPGIYAFKCRQAETLFNVLQECIQNSSNPYNNNNNGSSRVQSPSTLEEPTSITVNMLTPIVPPPDSSYLEPRSSDPAVLTSRSPGRGSITTPTTALATRLYVNEPPVHQYVNTSVDKYMNGLACVDLNTNYARLDELLKQERFYVNVTPDAKGRFYANMVEECSPSPCLTLDDDFVETAETPGEEPGSPQVNYIQLDLDQQQQQQQQLSQTQLQELSSVASSPPGSPQAFEGYATIDFARTAALSNSAVASIDDDQSVRKTRHNSTIA